MVFRAIRLGCHSPGGCRVPKPPLKVYLSYLRSLWPLCLSLSVLFLWKLCGERKCCRFCSVNETWKRSPRDCSAEKVPQGASSVLSPEPFPFISYPRSLCLGHAVSPICGFSQAVPVLQILEQILSLRIEVPLTFLLLLHFQTKIKLMQGRVL